MNKIVVSLTTYNSRINTINKVIHSINNQSIQPDIIVLYLCSNEINASILNIHKQENLQIRYVDENLKGHKKYYYALQEFRDDIVITLDDDVEYHVDTIKTLMDYHIKYPRCVIANRTRFLSIRDNNLESYYRWEKNFPVDFPSFLLMGTGVLGVLYPPYIFDNEVFNKELIIKYALDNDDIWLKVHQIRKGVKTVLTNLDKSLNFIDGTQDSALCKDNFKNDGCNQTIKDLIELFSIDVRKIFLEEFNLDLCTEIYNGSYSKCFKYVNFLVKTFNYGNSPENEYESTLIARESKCSGRRCFGFSRNPSIVVYDYISGEFLNKNELSYENYNSILEYIGKIQSIQTDKLLIWDKYKLDCIQALRLFSGHKAEEICLLDNAKCEAIIHGDLNPNNIMINEKELFVIDYENSSIGPKWWDKCYLLANYYINNIDSRVITTLSTMEIRYIIIILKIRIGRLIRKNMNFEEKLDMLKSWEKLLLQTINS